MARKSQIDAPPREGGEREQSEETKLRRAASDAARWEIRVRDARANLAGAETALAAARAEVQELRVALGLAEPGAQA